MKNKESVVIKRLREQLEKSLQSRVIELTRNGIKVEFDKRGTGDLLTVSLTKKFMACSKTFNPHQEDVFFVLDDLEERID